MPTTTISDILTFFTSLLVDYILPITFGLSLVAFFFGMARYVYGLGGETEKNEAKHVMTWGVVVMTLVIGIWAIITFAQGFLGIQGIVAPQPSEGTDPFEMESA